MLTDSVWLQSGKWGDVGLGRKTRVELTSVDRVRVLNGGWTRVGAVELREV